MVAGEGDAHAAGVAVVDEDRRPPGLVVVGGGEPADVPAVAHRDQRQHRDLRVLGCVQRALELRQREVRGDQVRRERVPERLRVEALLRQVDRQQVEDLVVGDTLLLVRDDLLGDRDDSEAQHHAHEVALVADLLDPGVGLLLRLRVPVAREGLDPGGAVVQVQLADLVALAHVQVDGAGVHGRRRARRLDVADHLAGVGVDDGDRVDPRGAQRDARRREPLPARQVAAVALAQVAGANELLGVGPPARAEEVLVAGADR